MKLFHYTSRDAALEHILPTARLRFGRLPRTNDPREFGEIWFPIAGRVGDDEPLTARSPFKLIEEANEHLRRSVHVLCLTEDRPSRWEQRHGYGNGPRRARMWAQYSDNHAGVCLCFDRQRLIDAAHDQLETDGRSVIDGPLNYLNEDESPSMADSSSAACRAGPSGLHRVAGGQQSPGPVLHQGLGLEE